MHTLSNVTHAAADHAGRMWTVFSATWYVWLLLATVVLLVCRAVAVAEREERVDKVRACEAVRSLVYIARTDDSADVRQRAASAAVDLCHAAGIRLEPWQVPTVRQALAGTTTTTTGKQA